MATGISSYLADELLDAVGNNSSFAVGAVYAALMTEEIRGVHEFKDLIL